jgi:hypothetical protein
MRRNFKFLAVAFATVGLLVANLGVASAHQWGSYHWDKTGSVIQIQNYIYGGTTSQAEAARANGWNTIGILYNYSVGYHTDISVFDGNFGATGWWGLATLEELNWSWGTWSYSHIGHAHARYNSYYGGTSADIQGIYCQEIAHGWGLDHSNTGDCMGKSYYNNINLYGPHNNTDFFNMYRYH